MIVVEEPNSGERSPLKTNPELPAQEAGGASPTQAAPPTYAVATAAHIQTYHSGAPRPPPPVTVFVYRESTLKRFLKAFGIALIIIFLWSAFLDSVDMAIVGPRRRPRGNGAYEDKDVGLEWLIRDWYKSPATSTPCTCSHDAVKTTGIVRALPMLYPPTPRLQVGLALSTHQP